MVAIVPFLEGICPPFWPSDHIFPIYYIIIIIYKKEESSLKIIKIFDFGA